MKKKPPKCCYPDCFNCPYADCRYDRLESEDFEPDQMEDVPESVLKARTRARKYENSHKEENRERSRKWYAENKERDKERAKKWNHVDATITYIDMRKWFATCPRWQWEISIEYDGLTYEDDSFASGAMNRPSFADSQEGDSVRVRLTNKYVNGELTDRFISEIR